MFTPSFSIRVAFAVGTLKVVHFTKWHLCCRVQVQFTLRAKVLFEIFYEAIKATYLEERWILLGETKAVRNMVPNAYEHPACRGSLARFLS
jgi:hypothetical protein